MLEQYITKMINLREGRPEKKREEILEYFRKTYELDEKLYETLSGEESFYMRADPLRHPLIFYFGHTAAFYINKMILANLISERVNPDLESMFAVGVDEMSWDDLNEEHYDWPTLEEVKEFRNRVKEIVENLILSHPLKMPITWENPFWIIMMGIEHERIHLETSSVLIRELPISQVNEHNLFPICQLRNEKAPENELLPVVGTVVEMGKSFTHNLYGWDNEYGTKKESVENFKASKYLVSNAEFLKFISDNGYNTEKYWTEEGWKWKEYKKAEMPIFWRKKEGKFSLRTMTKEIPMPWDWPVVVNQLEAKAFTNWLSKKTGKNLRLPTEAEWYCLYKKSDIPNQPDWEKAPGNINLEYWASSCPVNNFKFGNYYDVIGNVWQWTETPIFGFDNFKVHKFYDDFSTPTFDGKHNLIKGGSWISTGNEASAEARYAFRRHFFQHAGFRYVESDQEVKVENKTFEDDENVVNYCERDYGSSKIDFPNFSKKLAEICFEIVGKKKVSKAVNIGCKTGRTTFELARKFDKVTGLDFTARLIKVGTRLKEEGKLLYTFYDEGKIKTFNEVSLDEIGLAGTAERVKFYQADPSNFLKKFSGYDFVLIENMLEEMYNPKNFLKMIHERIKKDGILVISTSKSWNLEEINEKNLLGGYRKDGEPIRSDDVMRKILEKEFDKIDIIYHNVNYLPKDKLNLEVKISEISAWKKK